MHLIDEYAQKQLETAHQTFLSIGYIRAPAVFMLGTVIGLALRDYCATSAEKGWAEKDPSLEDVFEGMQTVGETVYECPRIEDYLGNIRITQQTLKEVLEYGLSS